MPGGSRVQAAADRRFRRARVKPVRRARGPVWVFRILRLAAVAAVAVYGAYRGTAIVFGAPALQVSRIVVRGNERLSTGEILGVLDGLQGSNILRARLGVWQRRLRTSPWVREAALRRVLPSTIEVLIWERQPVGTARLGNQLYLVDAEGTVMDEYGAQYDQFDLPIIDGLAAAPQGGAAALDPARAGLAARLIEDVGRDPALLERLSQVDVSDLRDAVVLLDGETALLHLGDDRFLERLRSFVELAGALHERIPRIDYVDLRFGERVYVRPAGRAGGPSAGRPEGRRAP